MMPDSKPDIDVEITPEMIEAGTVALRHYDHFFSLDPFTEELLVKEVVMAALSKAIS
jgi:hypothetical protein